MCRFIFFFFLLRVHTHAGSSRHAWKSRSPDRHLFLRQCPPSSSPPSRPFPFRRGPGGPRGAAQASAINRVAFMCSSVLLEPRSGPPTSGRGGIATVTPTPSPSRAPLAPCPARHPPPKIQPSLAPLCHFAVCFARSLSGFRTRGIQAKPAEDFR